MNIGTLVKFKVGQLLMEMSPLHHEIVNFYS